MKKILGMRNSRSTVATRREMRFRGMSGKKIAMFAGGAFIAALIVFYGIANWDSVGNGFLCFAQDIAGMRVHYHFPMRDGAIYGNCTAVAGGGTGVDGDNS